MPTEPEKLEENPRTEWRDSADGSTGYLFCFNTDLDGLAEVDRPGYLAFTVDKSMCADYVVSLQTIKSSRVCSSPPTLDVCCL